MWTEPGTIIEWIQQNCYINEPDTKIKLLYIITDGLIEPISVQKCFELNENMNYEMVAFHAIHENLDKIDLSVAASFFKNHCIVYRNRELYDNVNISKEFDYNKINVDNFEAERENLKSYIKLKFINKSNQDTFALQEINKLKLLRDQ
ncbi:Similar to Early 94 kDa protein (Autographa californica nuclear polyhedrosis virus), partial [Cotesia congregata]